jgi:large subunit ribosomal protein L9
MKAVLRVDVEGLGHKGDVVDVADGYARNYLVPKGLAMKASKGAELQAEGMRKARAIQDAADRDAAQEIASKLVSAVVTIPAKASGEGRLFGSVSAGDIVVAVHEQTGYELDVATLRLDEHIKDVGEHTVMARLHPEVEFPVHLVVEAE